MGGGINPLPHGAAMGDCARVILEGKSFKQKKFEKALPNKL